MSARSACGPGREAIIARMQSGGATIMEHDAWLTREAGRIGEDLKELQTDISLYERKFQVQMSDKERTLVLGDNEWARFRGRISDACKEMLANLEDFVENEYRRQLHWSALRLMTASGVMSAEFRAYREKLNYIARHPSNTAADVNRMVNWFEARIEPLYGRMSVRLVQIMSRVLNPQSWEISTDLTNFSGGASGEGSGVRLKLRFQPNTEEESRLERERVKRMQRLQVTPERSE